MNEKSALSVYAATPHDHEGAYAQATAIPGLFVIEEEFGTDSEPTHLGYVYKCTYHVDSHAAAKAVLVDLGFPSADAATRMTLATRVDEAFFSAGERQQPTKGWKPSDVFHPPEIAALPDGSIRRVRWSNVGKISVKGIRRDYKRFEIIFRPDGTIVGPNPLVAASAPTDAEAGQ
jgi:hypothetical protein